jgi:tetratricopeptide (TPR) repeat protein/CHAT domain-containing protein
MLGVLVMAAVPARGAAPPALGLDAARQGELARLRQQAQERRNEGRFEEGQRLARRELELRRRWQGEGHWQTVDARLALEVWQRLVRVPAKDRPAVARAAELDDRGSSLHVSGKFREAEKLLREALALRRRALGDGHPTTAVSYNNVGYCLNTQGRHAAGLLHIEKALAACRGALGEGHPDTAQAWDNLAQCLCGLGQFGRALPAFERALAIRRQALGEGHPDTAQSYNNTASCLDAQGLYPRAQERYEKALASCRLVFGEEHPNTGICHNNLALCLAQQGQYARARPEFERALAIRVKAWGDDHPATATGYNNLAYCLNAQGDHQAALPLYEKALAIRRRRFGDDNPVTAASYNSVGLCLVRQGRYARALPLLEKALLIRRAQGELHPETARAYNSLAGCLESQGQRARALPLFEKALATFRKVWGEYHPETANTCNTLAGCLLDDGQHARALLLLEKALLIRRQALGENHPDTVASWNSLAACLAAQGQQGRALLLHEKALAGCRNALGEIHPHTAKACNNVARCLGRLGRHAEALPLHERALASRRKALGEDHPDTAESCLDLAACLWRLGRVPEAVLLLQASSPAREVIRFHLASSGFGRAVAAGEKASPQALLALGLARLGQPRQAFRHAEAGLARALLDDLAPDSPPAVQSARLRNLEERLLPLFARDDLSPEQRQLRTELARQHREAAAALTREAAAVSVGQLLPLADIQEQLPPGAALVLWLDADALDERWACVVRRRGAPAWIWLRGSGGGGGWTAQDAALAGRLRHLLSDPQAGSNRERQGLVEALRRQRLDPLRPHLGARDGLPATGHLLVVPTGWAAEVPVEVLTADYRVSYVPSGSAFARLRKGHRPLAGAPLLALGDPAFSTPAARRKGSALALEWPDPPRLAGSRREVLALARLAGSATTLLGSEASEQRLDELSREGKLKAYRVVHLATHAAVRLDRPELSRLELARDRLPDRLEAAREDRKAYTGELTVAAILRGWRLDADLVVLSACQTGLGRQARGDGMLGFTQALLSRGARCVVLSRWKVDDDATAVLMQRFYQNLLGKRDGLARPLGRAAALEEARTWLRGLSRRQAGDRVAALRGPVVTLPPAKAPPAKLPQGDRPYGHPYYWAAFVLLGDPD